MTDKVQKILSEIATRKLCTMDEHMAFYNDTAKEDYRFLSEIEKLIKAFQEEPVSNELEKVVEEIVEPTILNAYGTKELARRLRNTICGTSVSEDLEEAIDTYLATYFGGEKEKQEWPFLKKMIIYFTKWQKEQLTKEAIDGVITFDYYGDDDKTYGCIAHDSFCLEDFGLKDTDKVKMILIKED